MDYWKEILLILLVLAVVFIFFDLKEVENKLEIVNYNVDNNANRIEENSNILDVLNERISENRKLIEEIKKR